MMSQSRIRETTQALLDGALADLEKISTHITVLDENPSSENEMWYPRNIRDLDVFASRVGDMAKHIMGHRICFVKAQ